MTSAARVSGRAACAICGYPTNEVGTVEGRLAGRGFMLRTCPACRFSFVADPWTDYDVIYSADYYHGEGADPLADYVWELEHFDATAHRYEWRGIATAVGSLVEVAARTRWLDFGCGNGGLVRSVRERYGCDVVGFEQGWIAERIAREGVPLLHEEELAAAAGTFDVVTAIEVLEHVPDPLAALARIRALLRPGGLFFFTTGNARPFRDKLLRWRYVIPEIHVSFFEPETLALALAKSGFRPQYTRFLPGHEDIIRYKILKNLRLRSRSRLEDVLPWGSLARLADRRYEVTAHPVGWARPGDSPP